MNRYLTFATLISTATLLACAGPAPAPEPGMKVQHHSRGEEVQVATDVDLSGYTKIILHSAPVTFMENWQRKQERLHGKQIRDEDVERIREAVSDRLAQAMSAALTEQGGYELTSDSGPDVMEFQPNIVDLNIQATGWMENSIVEYLPQTRGEMTVEVVIRDSASEKLLAVASQQQSDPRQGDMERTLSVNNAHAFRVMSRNWASWLVDQLDEARAGS